MTLLALCTGLLLCQAQATPDEAAALADFDHLPVLRQAMVVHRVEQRLAQTNDPLVRRIGCMRVDDAALRDAEPVVHFDPTEWARGAAPAREVVPVADARHRSVVEAMPPVAVLPDLARRIVYDWRRGTLVKSAAPPTWRERFANLVHGYPPNADVAYALVLAALDRDPAQRQLADYFEHTYADRDGRVYEGVTLYQAWYAGATIEMPDVDAIAFAVRVLGDASYSSPIPADARRDRLYARIHDRALEHRKYRTMLQAAAAAFVCATPDMDPMYARLAPRFHYLFASCGDDLDRARQTLQQLGTRDGLVEWVDQRVVADADAMELRDGRGRDLETMARTVREAAIKALEEERAAAAGHAPGR